MKMQFKILFVFSFNRNQDPIQRKEYVKMHDDVVDAGGDVKIFSSMHVSGERKYWDRVSKLLSRSGLVTQKAGWLNCWVLIDHLSL